MDVPTPFLRRRWVQMVAAVLLGFGLFWFGIWVTNGIRDERARQDQEEQEGSQRAALRDWRAIVEEEVGSLGPIQDPSPPALAADTRATATALADGNEPPIEPEALREQAAQMRAAADALESYELADRIRDRGFGERAGTILTSRVELVESLRLYATATELAADAIGSPDAETLASRAEAVLQSADRLLGDAWRAYQLVLAEAGAGSAPAIPGV